MRQKRLKVADLKIGQIIFNNMAFNTNNGYLIPCVFVGIISGDDIGISFIYNEEVCSRIISVNEVLLDDREPVIVSGLNDKSTFDFGGITADELVKAMCKMNK